MEAREERREEKRKEKQKKLVEIRGRVREEGSGKVEEEGRKE